MITSPVSGSNLMTKLNRSSKNSCSKVNVKLDGKIREICFFNVPMTNAFESIGQQFLPKKLFTIMD